MTYLIFVMLAAICRKMDIIVSDDAWIGWLIFGFICWIIHLCIHDNGKKGEQYVFKLSQKYIDFCRDMNSNADFLEGTTASGKTTIGAGVNFMLRVSASPK